MKLSRKSVGVYVFSVCVAFVKIARIGKSQDNHSFSSNGKREKNKFEKEKRVPRNNVGMCVCELVS